MKVQFLTEQEHRLRLRAAHPRWKTQTKTHDPENGIEGNCTQAAFASLLGLELDEVPDFNTLHQGDENAGAFWHHLHTWCREQGWHLQMRPANQVPNVLYLADGPSPRGVGHFVIMKEGEIYHDPHPSRAGILEVKHTWMLLPVDPAEMKKVTR
ncbi:hypothetical protein HOU00_gp062 [Caulobacter phage CcrPW]|uniref:Uncharacterized protein n=1 Tax=Caulobacter phage CcrPW TaxID=2283271 RepID=A0A385E9P8_9CAUD|nr:hypothetical protein HOU00_gp062 [Caulobacter phage CcrPW]AXQ68601.1 hypothetical protein CcrPW_gp062 [Caulobacter phage CcrPW]